MAIKTAITGVGHRGRNWIRELTSSPAFELVACVDVDETALASTARTYKLPNSVCYSSLDEALDDNVECQAVLVVTPAEHHFQDCQTALARGKAVLVEKPFTKNLVEANELVRLAKVKNVPLLVAQNYRYLRVYRAVRKLISEGRLGRIGMVICQYYRVPHEMSFAQTNATQSVLWGMGVHHLDVMRYVLGTEVNNVLSDDFTLSWTSLPKGASMRTMLSFENGARAFYSATYESRGHEFFERGQEFYARFIGELATLHVFQRWLLLCEKGKLPRFVRRGRRQITEEQSLLHQFERAIVRNEETEASGKDNLHTMAIVEACLRSATENKWVNPQELLNELQ
jgi:predicted dehydrogenase